MFEAIREPGPVHTLPRAVIFYLYSFTPHANTQLLLGSFSFWLLPGHQLVPAAPWQPPSSCCSLATSWFLLLLGQLLVSATPWPPPCSCCSPSWYLLLFSYLWAPAAPLPPPGSGCYSATSELLLLLSNL
jgi:hypothetical protein